MEQRPDDPPGGAPDETARLGKWTAPPVPPVPPERVVFWRRRLRQVGPRAFVEEELLPLPVWPRRDDDERRRVRALLERLRIRQAELAWVRAALEAGATVTLPDAGAVPAFLAALRRARLAQRAAPARTRASPNADHPAVEPAPDPGGEAPPEPAPPAAAAPGRLRHLGEGVSAGLGDRDGGRPTLLARLGLPALGTPEDVAAAIGIGAGELAWLTYHRRGDLVDHYHRFTIPKRNGGARGISSPKGRLRVAQRWLLEAVLAPLEPRAHAAAMGYRVGRSILDNARRHAGRPVVVRVDLTDFFGTVGFRRVRGLFASLGYAEGVATVLALLATEAPRVAATLDGVRRYVAVGERRLPQGGCTSPAITNLLCRRLDARLAGLARRLGWDYTRYADDLVFSHPGADAGVGALLAGAQRVVGAEGFRVNEAKTRVMRPQHRQLVTGLVANERPRVPRAARRRFRALLHHCEVDGLVAVSARLGQDALNYATGFWAFLHMTDPAQARRVRARYPWLRRPDAPAGEG